MLPSTYMGASLLTLGMRTPHFGQSTTYGRSPTTLLNIRNIKTSIIRNIKTNMKKVQTEMEED